MNILFLAPRLPLPADTGGKIRTLNILKQLAKTNQVHLLCFTFESGDESLAQTLRDLGISVSLVPHKAPGLVRKVGAVLFDRAPFSMSKYDSPNMRAAIEGLMEQTPFDAVHVDHLHMSHYTDSFGKLPCVLDEHNVEHKLLERCADVEASGLKKTVYRAQAAKMKLFESKKTKEFSAILACSWPDRVLLSRLTYGLVPTHVVPNGVDTSYFNGAQKDSLPQEDSLVFTGSMDWLPNEDAITYFCEQILPLIWQENKTVKLYVVGKSPSQSVKLLSQKDPRVVVTGRVDDVRPYVLGAKIFVVPLRIGGGTRLKILEAMSMGRAVVSTTVGAEGIEHTNKLNIALADGASAFARAVLDLLKEPQLLAEMGREGCRLVAEKYDWNVVSKTLNQIYHEVVHESK